MTPATGSPFISFSNVRRPDYVGGSCGRTGKLMTMAAPTPPGSHRDSDTATDPARNSHNRHRVWCMARASGDEMIRFDARYRMTRRRFGATLGSSVGALVFGNACLVQT